MQAWDFFQILTKDTLSSVRMGNVLKYNANGIKINVPIWFYQLNTYSLDQEVCPSHKGPTTK